MGIMPANSNDRKGNGNSDAINNANSRCNIVSTEDGATTVFETKDNGNSNGHTSIGG